MMKSTKEHIPASPTGVEQLSCSTADLVERARGLATAGKDRYVLGIVGAPGAGKSTLVRAITEALDGQAVAIGMDAFHLANQVLAVQGSRNRKGAPDTFDPWGYANLLQRLRSNREPIVYAPKFERSLEESIGSAIPVPRQVPLVITEGNYILVDADGWRQCREQIDEVWYLDIDDDVRRLRLVRRHEEFGKRHNEAVAWATGSDQHNAETVQATREYADLIVALVGSQGLAPSAHT
ncbi:hypothetical protein ART_3399 [Arthrobacter sp. PAMC 25486]|uniref:nucleoside/nucleotide kinase family protein n=1 Tax=Arthrobacter sp. PAMC 25486 TaxID=1494608 RepID=UPI0005360673|nr:nucleoside/nucleotide kinase family protein [Arthrobacter sp. PAMC 25486]AIY02998.1 hypothetical protein ART_3399 [Arthrobacter sp. PAMC 25486]